MNEKDNIRNAVSVLGFLTVFGAAVLAGHHRIVNVVGFAIIWFSIAVFFFVKEYRFRRTHTPEEQAAVAAQSQLRRDRIKFATLAAARKGRKVLRTGAEARAVITAAHLLGIFDRYRGRLVYLELAVTVGADAPYAVRTGEYPPWWGSHLAVGRELAVRVDLTDWQRVAVDWKKSEQLRQPPAVRLQELEIWRATGEISDAEYTATRERIIADT
jgi:hypothetical protein